MLYCGERETLRYVISQLKKDKGDERRCMTKGNGMIVICNGLLDLRYALHLHLKGNRTPIFNRPYLLIPGPI